MKSTEFIIEDEVDRTIDADMRDPVRRQARLKAEIEAGMMPTVQNASGSSSPVYTMGDVQALGWMDKEYTHDSAGEVDGWNRFYHHDAPGAIRVSTGGGQTVVWEPGHMEDN